MSAECSICISPYDDIEHKPLMLPCGHTFCQECLVQMDGASNKCVVCQKSLQSRDIKSLPVCYQLIGSTKPTSLQSEVCDKHKDAASLWCISCKIAICPECVRDSHRDCKWYVIEHKVKLLKIDFGKELEAIRKLIADETISLLQFQKLVQSMKSFSDETKALYYSLQCHEESLISFINDLQDDADLLSSQLDNKLSFPEMLEQNNKAKSLLSKEAPKILTSLLSYKTNSDGNIEQFIIKLRYYAEKCVGQATNEEIANFDKEQVEKLMGQFLDLKPWLITNQVEAAAGLKILSTTERRPSSFTISGIDWHEPTISDFLSKPIFYNYEIIFKPIDYFYRHSDTSASTTDKRIGSLLAGNNNAKLTTVWGHLNQATIDKLPNTVTSLGLVLHCAQDVQTLNALINAIYMSTEYKLFSLRHLDLVVSKQLAIEDCKIQWQTETTESCPVKWQGARCGNPLQWLCSQHQHQSMGHIIGRTPTILGIHLPDVTSDCTKAFNIVCNITNKGSVPIVVQNLYLPYTTVSETVLLGRVRDCGWVTTIHLPSSSAPPARDVRLTQFIQDYRKYGFNLVYDAESN